MVTSNDIAESNPNDIDNLEGRHAVVGGSEYVLLGSRIQGRFALAVPAGAALPVNVQLIDLEG